MSTANIVTAVVAVLSIAATVILGFSARAGSRHHVENVKLASEALEKTQDETAKLMITLYIARETAKLHEGIHPQVRRARRLLMIVASVYIYLVVLLLSGQALVHVLAPAGERWFTWGMMIIFVGYGVLISVAVSRYRRVLRRRRRITERLDSQFLERTGGIMWG